MNSISHDIDQYLARCICRYLREDGGLGTAGGLYRFQQEICEDMTAESRLFVLHCDVLCPMPLRDVLRFHDAHGKIATVVSKRVSISSYLS